MESTTQVSRVIRVLFSWWILSALIVGSVSFAIAQTASTSTVPTLRVEPKDVEGNPKSKYQFDKDFLYLSKVKDLTPIRSNAEDSDEYDAYNDLVLHANRFATADLQTAARLDVSYGDLFSKVRVDYRFELIQFTGRLKRLRRIEANEFLKANGVKELFEAWVVPNNDNNPMCIILTEKPDGIEPNLEYNPSYPVTATGYFFKLFEYQSQEPSEKTKGAFLTRRAPLLMGKSIALRPVEDRDGGGPWREVFLPALLTFLGLAAVFALGVTWYFRRGDRRSIQILESKKGNPFDEGAGPPAEASKNAE